MEPLYATELVNFFPDAGRVESRRGYEQHADVGSMLPVETLVSHLGGAMRKLFAVTSEAVYDVTDPEAITTDVNTGITAGRWRSATLNRNTVMVNGTDAPLRHDESGAWVPHGFTGTVTPCEPHADHGVPEPAVLPRKGQQQALVWRPQPCHRRA